jgi:hypothetical protein
LQELAVVVNFGGDDDDDTSSSPLPYGNRGGSGAGGIMGLLAVRRNPPLFSKSPASLLLLSKLLTLYC